MHASHCHGHQHGEDGQHGCRRDGRALRLAILEALAAGPCRPEALRAMLATRGFTDAAAVTAALAALQAPGLLAWTADAEGAALLAAAGDAILPPGIDRRLLEAMLGGTDAPPAGHRCCGRGHGHHHDHGQGHQHGHGCAHPPSQGA